MQKPRVTEESALRLAKKIHRAIITAHREMWRLRCDEMKAQKLLFKDRIKIFSKQKPLHEMSEDDFYEFAEAWFSQQEDHQTQNPKTVHTARPKPSKRPGYTQPNTSTLAHTPKVGNRKDPSRQPAKRQRHLEPNDSNIKMKPKPSSPPVFETNDEHFQSLV
jgi:hypothetical protein